MGRVRSWCNWSDPFWWAIAFVGIVGYAAIMTSCSIQRPAVFLEPGTCLVSRPQDDVIVTFAVQCRRAGTES